jgi:hypothetical protein
MIEVRKLAGRLVAVRSIAPVKLEDVEKLGVALAPLVKELSGGMLMIADLRPCGIVPQDVADRIMDLQRHDNPVVLRHAYLIGEGQGSLSLQLSRMLREAGHQGRRSFTDPKAGAEWLNEVTTDTEKRALSSFLNEGASLPVRAMGK